MTDDAKRPRERDRPAAAATAAGAVSPAFDIGRLAHELRTPLGAISVLAEIIRDERLGPLGNSRYRTYAADIYDSAAHANGILVGFLDPATAASPTFGSLEFAELDLAELVGAVVSALAPLADRYGVALRADLGPGLPRAILDRRVLRQILDNLVANALKFTPPGGEIMIVVGCVPGGPATIAVVDTGDGMTAAELEQVQGDGKGLEPLRRRSGGTGIGLPLVRALAAACGSRIAVESALGKGTRITLVVPPDRLVPV